MTMKCQKVVYRWLEAGQRRNNVIDGALWHVTRCQWFRSAITKRRHNMKILPQECKVNRMNVKTGTSQYSWPYPTHKAGLYLTACRYLGLHMYLQVHDTDTHSSSFSAFPFSSPPLFYPLPFPSLASPSLPFSFLASFSPILSSLPLHSIAILSHRISISSCGVLLFLVIILRRIQEKNNEILNINNRLSSLQTRLDEAENETMKWDSLCSRQQNTTANKSLLLARVQMYSLLCVVWYMKIIICLSTLGISRCLNHW